LSTPVEDKPFKSEFTSFLVMTEVLEGLILNIPGAITLSLFTPLDSYGVETEFEVTGFDKAFAPPSPDYIPGPEEPEQAPPSPDYVPSPVHADDEIVAEDQPYPKDASPIAQSPEYVLESDFEVHLEDDDDEDPEEDPAPSAEETEPFETDESEATPPPHPAYRMTARISIPAPVPMPAWTDSEAADRRRQTLISELLRIDHRRSTEISELRTALQEQVTALHGHVTALHAQVTT
nr:hypothetical protein [Tanacetum cinerariifolium]